ncbi:T-cell surface glycoprotein CD8 beta chain [Sorex araneus]|uniref:T-cell surface glycoprotein CD8 beta chain n=1 Tax=Sorex araneus TaxID=42254 RepID=UPI0024340B77|nr:T-cell surface glycoprotein CD8 beta chain [Sorex araneus]
MHLHRWLILAAQLSALLGDLVLHQTPRNAQVQTNGMVVMSCEMKGSSGTSSIAWVKRCLTLSADCQLEFLAQRNSQNELIYGKKVEKRLIVQEKGSQFTFNLTSLTPSDSGVYFCMLISREKTFGMGTQLNVVDVLPTSAQTTTKSTPKKKVCQLPSPVAPKGLQRRAQIQFLKQFYR